MGATVWMLQCHLQHNILSVGVKKGTKRWGENVPKCSAADRHQTVGRRGRPSITPVPAVFALRKCSGTPRRSPPPPTMFAILWCEAHGPDSTFPSHWLIARGYVCFGAPVRRQRGLEAKALACEQPLTNTWNTRSARWSKKVYVCMHGDACVGLKQLEPGRWSSLFDGTRSTAVNEVYLVKAILFVFSASCFLKFHFTILGEYRV